MHTNPRILLAPSALLTYVLVQGTTTTTVVYKSTRSRIPPPSTRKRLIYDLLVFTRYLVYRYIEVPVASLNPFPSRRRHHRDIPWTPSVARSPTIPCNTHDMIRYNYTHQLERFSESISFKTKRGSHNEGGCSF